MSSAGYVPWEVVEDFDVPVDGSAFGFSTIRVPWVAAASAERLLTTAQVSAGIVLRDLQLIAEAEHKHATKENVSTRKYDPPFVRFRCPHCEDTWDAWVDDRGYLEDKRDAFCANKHCDRKGSPGELEPEDD